MKNYRPVSNLSFLSNILEKVVASRLNSHTNSSHTSNDYQSAYNKFHSTETALLKIHNDLLSSMDDFRVTALTLLDLSAAFDTIDHTILLRRLDNWFGVSGKALDWFKSYLTGRNQRIKLGNCLSSRSDLSFWVPQGSVLGPLLFTLYTTPLNGIIKEVTTLEDWCTEWQIRKAGQWNTHHKVWIMTKWMQKMPSCGRISFNWRIQVQQREASHAVISSFLQHTGDNLRDHWAGTKKFYFAAAKVRYGENRHSIMHRLGPCIQREATAHNSEIPAP